MIRCGLPRWDAKDKVCDSSVKEKTTSKMEGSHLAPTMAKKETDDALAKLLAERAKLDNFWKQLPTQDGQ